MQAYQTAVLEEVSTLLATRVCFWSDEAVRELQAALEMWFIEWLALRAQEQGPCV
jgi:hypothetical protein